MNAVFVSYDAVLLDSHLGPDTPCDTWRLAPATVEALRGLYTEETFLCFYGDCSSACAEDPHDAVSRLVDQVKAAGGAVDATVTCEHCADENACGCWKPLPTMLWIPADELALDLSTCYLIGTSPRDIQIATSAGVRPVLILGDRSIAETLGNTDAARDCGYAHDLTAALSYVTMEEEIRQQVGRPLADKVEPPSTEVLYDAPHALPTIDVLSSRARQVASRKRRARAQQSDLLRWLALLTVGGVGLSLGVAYLLTHLYRIQTFPDYVSTLTLQFIPRPIRGALFIVVGLVCVALAVRSFRKTLRHRTNQAEELEE